MSRPFSIHTALRQVPNRLLREFLANLNCGDLGITWDALKEKDIDPMLAALSKLPQDRCDAVEAELRRVFDLATPTGVSAFIEAARCHGDPEAIDGIPEDGTVYEKAMWAWLHKREVFGTASLIHRIEHLTWWRKRTDLPKKEPTHSKEALDALGRAISRVFLEEQGCGRRCTVEYLRRGDTDHFYAHPDDHVQTVNTHDNEGVLASQIFRQTFPVVYAFNGKEGTLELFAKGPAPLKTQLESAFAEVVLGCPLGELRPQPAYSLNHLLAGDYLFVTDPEDRVKVRLRKMRLHPKNSGRRITLEADPDAHPRDLHGMIDEVLDKRNVDLQSVNVGLVTLHFEFSGEEGCRGGSMTFDVAWPTSCGLRNQRPEYIEIARKYLKRWGIDAGNNSPLVVAAARP